MLIARGGGGCFLKSWQYFASYGKSIFYWRYLSHSWYAGTKSKALCLWIKSFTFFSFSKSRQYFCPFWQINITELPFICANLSNSWYVNTKSRAWCLWIKSFTFFSPKVAARLLPRLSNQYYWTSVSNIILFLFVLILVIRDT